jgi:hypothetical protein
LANLNQIGKRRTVNALMLRGIFAKFPTQSCREFKAPNLIPSREFKSRSGEFGAPLEMPIREPDMHMGQRGLSMNENQVKQSQGNATSPRWGIDGSAVGK